MNTERVENIKTMLNGEPDLKEVTTYEGILHLKITPEMLADETVHEFTWAEMLEACKTVGVVEEVENTELTEQPNSIEELEEFQQNQL